MELIAVQQNSASSSDQLELRSAVVLLRDAVRFQVIVRSAIAIAVRQLVKLIHVPILILIFPQ